MPEHSEVINLGFSVADAAYPEITLQNQRLLLRFLDWRERPVTVVFADTIGVRWQEAERYIDDNDRFDATVVVHESAWLAENDRSDITWQGSDHRHLKLNFNACGILEVLCTNVSVED